MKHENKGRWGNLLKQKEHNCTRILSHNTGGTGFISGERSKESLRMERLKLLCVNYDIDLVCLLEVNRDWRSVQQKNTIWNGTLGWKDILRVQVSNNTNTPSTNSNQFGGTDMVTFNDLVFNISGQGTDDRSLSIWSYMTITGKNDVTSTFITCYCPVASTSPGSAYSQHLIYIAENKGKFSATLI